jgi:hypothetical protein
LANAPLPATAPALAGIAKVSRATDSTAARLAANPRNPTGVIVVSPEFVSTGQVSNRINYGPFPSEG